MLSSIYVDLENVAGKHFIHSVIDIYEPQHEISNHVVCATSKGSDQPAHTRSLVRVFASRVKIL